ARPSGTSLFPYTTLFRSLMQAEMVAREIRRLLDREGYHPGEIGVLVRSMAGIAPLLRNVFARYEIPVWLQAGERLGENPFIACRSEEHTSELQSRLDLVR